MSVLFLCHLDLFSYFDLGGANRTRTNNTKRPCFPDEEITKANADSRANSILTQTSTGPVARGVPIDFCREAERSAQSREERPPPREPGPAKAGERLSGENVVVTFTITFVFGFNVNTFSLKCDHFTFRSMTSRPPTA